MLAHALLVHSLFFSQALIANDDVSDVTSHRATPFGAAFKETQSMTSPGALFSVCWFVLQDPELLMVFVSWHNEVSRVLFVLRPTPGLFVLKGGFTFLNRDSTPDRILKPFPPILKTLLAPMS